MFGSPFVQRGARNLGISLSFTFSFFIIELAGGLLTNSLALLTDAWHMFNDVLALAFSLAAARIAQRPETTKRTYGYYRAEVLAALLQGMLLWVVVAFIFWEAVQRIQEPAEVESSGMLVIAFLGLLVNGSVAFILSKSKEESLNIKGAFLHVVADALGSVAAVSAGIVMLLTEWYQIDSIVSMMIGVLILYISGKVIWESINVLLEGVPSHIDLGAIERRMIEVKGVKSVHDLHVWCVTPTRMCIMSGHVVAEEGADKKELTRVLIRIMKEEFGIDHTTIQLEDEGYPKAPSEHI